jgi:transposase-like protein
MYLAGVSVRRVEDITQALWGTRVSASTLGDHLKTGHLWSVQNRPLCMAET